MSDYTAYDAINTPDIEMTRQDLQSKGVTSVLIADWEHPLFEEVDDLARRWRDLPFDRQWLVLMKKEGAPNISELFPGSVYLMVDEDPTRWALNVRSFDGSLELLFSDAPWGDMCDSDPRRDLLRIERARNVGDSDLGFIEGFFRVPRSRFQDHLSMGRADQFLQAVGLPDCRGLCDWRFEFPEAGKARCLLWKEYEALVGYL